MEPQPVARRDMVLAVGLPSLLRGGVGGGGPSADHCTTPHPRSLPLKGREARTQRTYRHSRTATASVTPSAKFSIIA